MYTQRTDRKRAVKAVIILIVVTAVIIVFYSVGMKLETKQEDRQRGVQSEEFSSFKRVNYDGKTYRRKSGITPILMIGVDKEEEDAVRTSYRNGGQADFLVLMVIDDSEKAVHMLQIDRDTMANITVLGVLGQEVGKSYLQICLSHSFGRDPKQNCRYTVEAVRNLLEGEEIELYMSMNMGSISEVNDFLGGVTVTIEDDFSGIDPSMVKGSTMKLMGKQAEIFVRARRDMPESTNVVRMRRQKAYITAAVSQLRSMLENDATYAESMMNGLEQYFISNAETGRIINEINRSYYYTIEEVVSFPGEHRIGKDGFVEFYPERDAVIRWILNVFYKEEN